MPDRQIVVESVRHTGSDGRPARTYEGILDPIPPRPFSKPTVYSAMPNLMQTLRRSFDQIDRVIAGWMQENGTRLLRISLGIIFVWFGALKFFDGMSPAESLVRRTVYWMDPDLFIPILGGWEVLIGLGLLYRPAIRAAIFLLFAQMPGTLLPLILLPEVCFTIIPVGLTLEGQYIIKNLVLISAALVVGGTVRSDIRKSRPA